MKNAYLMCLIVVLIGCSPISKKAPLTIETAIVQVKTQKAIEEIVKATIITGAFITPLPRALISTSYSLIDIEKGFVNPKKCILDIRLPNRISEDQIKQIAEKIKNNEGVDCSPLGIFYFLPGEKPGIDSAWAYSHFNPQLEVGINGMSLETKAKLESTTPQVEGYVIGNWLDTYAFSRTITIAKINNTYQMTSIYSDGSNETIELGVKVNSGEEHLYENPGNYFGDYMVIKKNGNLAFYDKQGIIYEIPPI